MPKNGREGIAWSWAYNASVALRFAAQHSQILKWFRRMVPDGPFLLAKEEPKIRPAISSTRRRLMQMRENSRILVWLDDVRMIFLSCRISSLALGVLLSVLFFAVGSVFLHRGVGAWQWGLAVSAAVVALPALPSVRSLGYALKESRSCRWILFDVCGISEDAFVGQEIGKRYPLSVLIFAFLSGVFMTFWTPLIWLSGLAAFAFLWLLFSVPEIGPVFVFAAFPFLQYFAHPTLLLCAVILSCDLAYFAKAICGRREWVFGTCECCVLFLCFLFAAGGAIGAGRWEDGILAACLASFYFPVRFLLKGKTWRMRSVFAVQISSLTVSLFGIWQYFFGDLTLLWTDADRFSDIGVRVISVFDNPNVLAIYLLFALPFSLYGAVFSIRVKRCRIFSVCSALGILLCILLTWSRGAWLGAMAELLFFFLFAGYQTRAALLLLPIPITAALPYLPHSVTNRFLSIGSLSESSIRYRLDTWTGVFRMLGAHPWGIGVGESAFSAVYPQYAVSGTETVMHAHGLFLQIACEIGFLGAAVFLIFLILLALRAGTYGRGLCGMTALSGILIMGMFDHIWYERGMLALFFAACAGAAMGRRNRWN